MPDLAVPARLRDITPRWLTRALNSTGILAPGARVVSAQGRTIGGDLGFIGECVLFQLRYEPPAAGPSSMVAKIPSPFRPGRDLAAEHGLYRTETAFYRHLAGRTPWVTPRCYWSGFDEASGGFLLLLEDLSGLRASSSESGCSEGDARAALAALGRIHAAWWQQRELSDSMWLPTSAEVDEWQTYYYLDASPAGTLAPSSGHLGAEEVMTWTRVRANAAFLRRWAGEQPQTLAHGDFRLENVFFDDASSTGTRAVILDWQLTCAGPVGRDVAYFLGWNLTPRQRSAWEEALVRHYHGELLAGGLTGPSFEQVWDDYRVGLMQTALMGASSLLALQAAKAVNQDTADESSRDRLSRAGELFDRILERCIAAVIDTRACDLLPD